MTQPQPTVSALFDDTVYNPAADPTRENWNGSSVRNGAGSYDLAEKRVTHGIAVTDGVAAFASVRAPAWHNLGVVFEKPTTAAELLKAAHADYTVFKMPDYAHVSVAADGLPTAEDSEERPPVRQVVLRDDRKMKTVRKNPVSGALEILGTVSPTYQVHQNDEAFIGFGDALIDTAEPNVATCGVLRNGAEAFMCWKLPRGTLVGGVDAVEWWLLLRTSHDLTVPLTAAVTPLRTVCQNTVRWNLGRAISKWSIRHTRNSKLAVQDARTSLKLSYAYAEQWDGMAEQMIRAELTNAKFAEIIEREFGPDPDQPVKEATARAWEQKRDKLIWLFAQADTQANVRGTAWAGLQAVTEFCDWETSVTKASGSLDPNGYRFFRSITDEKSVTVPKTAALRAIAGYAGIALPKPVKNVSAAAV